MNIKEQIQNTATFKELIVKTPFLKTTLLSKNVVEGVQRIIYQIEKLGEDYILDKNYDNRQVAIAKEIILNQKS